MTNVYAVYDSVACVFCDPSIAPNHDLAKRNFITGCLDPSIMEHFLSDIELFYIGTFDNQTGVITPDQHRLIIRGDHPDVLMYRDKYQKLLSISKEGESE